ncbi:MAG: abortive infection family protein [Solirubrobacterales bacterium]
MRAVVEYALATDRTKGARMVDQLIQRVRAVGGFRENSENYIGQGVYIELRDAFRDGSFDLTPEGELIPRLLDSVPAAEQDEVLRVYIKRIRQGASDAALVTGTGKDLLEATARRTLDRHRREYAGHDFPGTLFHAFDATGLPTPSGKLLDTANKEFSADPRDGFKEALYLLGLQINRLRNKEGTGHGRAFPSEVSDKEAKLAAEAMGLISELLLGDSE